MINHKTGAIAIIIRIVVAIPKEIKQKHCFYF